MKFCALGELAVVQLMLDVKPITGGMVKFFNKYVFHISLVFVGFYFSAIVLSYSHAESKDLIVVLNSLGNFISAGGALAAILTVINHVQTQLREKEDRSVTSASYVLFILERQHLYTYMIANKVNQFTFQSEEHRAIELPIVSFDKSLVNAIDMEKCISLSIVNSPDLLRSLDTVQRNYDLLYQAFCQRNSLYQASYKDKLEPINKHLEHLPSKDVINEVGCNVIRELVFHTNEMLKLLINVNESLDHVESELRASLENRYPEASFIGLTKQSR